MDDLCAELAELVHEYEDYEDDRPDDVYEAFIDPQRDALTKLAESDWVVLPEHDFGGLIAVPGRYGQFLSVGANNAWLIEHKVGREVYHEALLSRFVNVGARRNVRIHHFPGGALSQAEQVRLLESAMHRVQQLQELISEISDDDEDEPPQQPLSQRSIQLTLEIFRLSLRYMPPRVDVAIFPLLNGGLHLQVVGDDRTVSLAIPPTEPFVLLGEYASHSAYHREEFEDAEDAARFFAMSVQ